MLRDFRNTHPDFEKKVSGDQTETGVVEDILGADDTPTYAHAVGTRTVTSPATFAEWFHDVPGVNVAIPYEIALSPSAATPGTLAFNGKNFFPLDSDPRGFGNEDQAHDYDFTLVASATFTYHAGDWFHFSADDDLWVFVNRRLAVDLGGLHESKPADVYLDDVAGTLEIEPGHLYAIELFFAERHMVSTDLSIVTNASDLVSCAGP